MYARDLYSKFGLYGIVLATHVLNGRQMINKNAAGSSSVSGAPIRSSRKRSNPDDEEEESLSAGDKAAQPQDAVEAARGMCISPPFSTLLDVDTDCHSASPAADGTYPLACLGPRNGSFAQVVARVKQLPFKDEHNEPIRPWQYADVLRPGTVVMVSAGMKMWHMTKGKSEDADIVCSFLHTYLYALTS